MYCAAFLLMTFYSLMTQISNVQFPAFKVIKSRKNIIIQKKGKVDKTNFEYFSIFSDYLKFYFYIIPLYLLLDPFKLNIHHIQFHVLSLLSFSLCFPFCINESKTQNILMVSGVKLQHHSSC